jgi:hypothetical protein
MRQPPRPEWLDEPSMKGAPVFGYNAVPWITQFVFFMVLGFAVYTFFKWIGVGDLGEYLMKSLIDSLG